MTALAEVRRRRTWAMLGITVVAALLVPAVGYAGVRALLASTGGVDARADNLPIRVFPSTPTALHLALDPFGRLSAATVFVLQPSGVGGSIVVMPVNVSMIDVDGTDRSLRETYDDEGPDAVAAAVESLALVAIDHVEVRRAGEIAGTLLAFGPLTVDLAAQVPAPDDVAVADGVELDAAAGPSGAAELPLPSGTAVLDAATAAAVLTSAADSSALGHDEHTRNVEAVWVGVALANGAGRQPGLTVGGPPPDAATVRDRLFAGQVAVRRVAVGERAGATAGSASGSTNSDGTTPWPADEAVELDRADAVFVFASIAPASMSGPSPGPLFRVEAPPGYDAEVKRTIEKIQFLGGNVVSVDLAAPEQPGTVFLVPDQVNRDEAEQTNGIFGDFEFVDPTERIEGIDMTVVLGTDYLATALS